MKKIIVLGLFLLCLLGCFSVSAQDIGLYMFGNEIECDVPPVIENGRTLVPVRAIAEDGLGAEVEWNGESRIVTVRGEDVVIVLPIDHPQVFVNGEPMTLDAPAKIIDGRTMVPVRFVSEALKYSVEWEPESLRVIIDEAESEANTEENTEETETNETEVSEPENPNKITLIDVEPTAFDTLVNFEMSVNVEPDVVILTDPYRIVVDFEGFTYTGGLSRFDIENANVKQVRWAEHEEFYRVVIECNGEQKYRYVKTGENTFSIVVYSPDLIIPEETEDIIAPSDPDSDFVYVEPVSPEMIVIIDPGHGGKDPGALGRDEYGNILYNAWGVEEVREKDINLSVARRVYEYLTNGGINVVMTHSDDSFVELKRIAEIANEYNAALFVSIHSNSVENIPTANGTEVLYYDTDYKTAYGISSSSLATNILKEMNKVSGMTNRGIKERPGLAVMKWTNMPAALVELGFVTNAGDRAKLVDSVWQDKVAAAIAKGIETSLGKVNR